MEDTMTKQEAEQIIQDIIEAAYLNARDIDPEQAEEIQKAADIVFSNGG
jgi:hypothetical protein